MNIRNRKDFYSGLIFIFFGFLAVVVARNYPMGSALRMGPGYFPIILGSALAVLGFMIAARSLWLSRESIEALALRPLLFVLGALVAFALLIQPLGLVTATVALVVIGSLARGEIRLGEVGALSLVLAAIAVSLFVYGLGLPLSVWPQ